MKKATGTYNRVPSLEIRQRLSSNIKGLRQIRDYTQERLGKLCGLQKAYIGDVEQANVNISLANLEAIANGLGCSASDLLRREIRVSKSRDVGSQIVTSYDIPLPSDVRRAFGDVLIECRRIANISQEELAYRAGLDRTYPSLMERGKRQPTIGRLIAIGIALDVKPSTLVMMTVEKLPVMFAQSEQS